MQKIYEEFPFLVAGAGAIPCIVVLCLLVFFFFIIEQGIAERMRLKKEKSEHDIHRFAKTNNKKPNTS